MKESIHDKYVNRTTLVKSDNILHRHHKILFQHKILFKILTISYVQTSKYAINIIKLELDFWEQIIELRKASSPLKMKNSVITLPSPSSIWDQCKSPLYYFVLDSISNHNFEIFSHWANNLLESKGPFERYISWICSSRKYINKASFSSSNLKL